MQIVVAATLLLCLTGEAALAEDFSGHDLTGQIACQGRPVRVVGDHNRVTADGPCPGISVSGDGNVVGVALVPGGLVRVSGSDNVVMYQPPAAPPTTALQGPRNVVLPGPGLAATRPLPFLAVPSDRLVLDGTSGRDVSCAGRDVTILESAARYVLRGGCRSVTIEGTRDSVAAELLPGARLVIGAIGVVVNYGLVADGPPPDVVVTAANAEATHFSRIGDGSVILPTRHGAAGRF